MFKFNFFEQNCVDEKEENANKKNQLNWLSAKKIEIPQQLFENNCENIHYILNTNFHNLKLKIVDAKKVIINLTKEKNLTIVEAESKHSDLIPAKYEGGLKIWECTYDLGNYLLSEEILFNNKAVLDLGCGAGIIGLIALLQGATVHFQDYNIEVIKSVTIPNVMLNCSNYKIVQEQTKFYGGDWESFENILKIDNKNKKYDYIFTSETIYNLDNYQKLYKIFKSHLKDTGICYIAAKTYYFGIGGGTRQFEEFALRDNIFDINVVWKSKEGLQREILKLKRITF